MNPINDPAILSPWEPGLLSLALYALMAFFVVAAMLVFAARLGKGQPAPEKLEPYESGVRARLTLSIGTA